MWVTQPKIVTTDYTDCTDNSGDKWHGKKTLALITCIGLRNNGLLKPETTKARLLSVAYAACDIVSAMDVIVQGDALSWFR
ncbi:MAG: hypothetical protein ABIJ53_10300, partial [Verrucomicrobiota bacterium]